jgi:N-acetylneuraminic acid mutarotase
MYQSTVTTLADGRVLVAGGRSLGNPFGYTANAEIYDPFSATWTPVAPMGNARYGAIASLLPDGKVLVCGGSGDSSGVFLECERYDVARDLWLATAVKPMFVSGVEQAVTLATGTVAVFGGPGSGGNPSRTELYDPATNTWKLGNFETSDRAQGPGWTTLSDGRVFVAGGSSTATYDETFDPITQKWTKTADSGTARRYATATLLADGRVLVAGGQGGTGAYLASAQIYDPVNNTWSNAAPLPAARAVHDATLLLDGRVLVMGGETNSGISSGAAIYDPSTDAWTAAPSMTFTRDGFSIEALADGGVLIVGGRDGSNNLVDPEVYEPAGPLWSRSGSLATARTYHSAALLKSGALLVAGGYTGVDELSSAELFDPSSGSWSSGGTMLHTHNFNATATRLSSGKVLVAGGNELGGTISDADLYDPATNSWSTGGTMGHRRNGATATLLADGRVLVAGGSDGSAIMKSTELYDPATNGWSAGADMNFTRTVATATLLADGKVLVAGGSDGTLDLASAEVYDPAANTWSLVAPMGTPLEAAHSVRLLDGRVLVAGGELYATLPAFGQIYDPVANAWTDTGPYDIGRVYDGIVIDASGQPIMVGGAPVGGGALSSVVLYDPVTNQWYDDEELLDPLGGATVTLLKNGRIAAVGGSQTSVVPFTDLSPRPKPVTISTSSFMPSTASLPSVGGEVTWRSTAGRHSIVDSSLLGPLDPSNAPTPLFDSGTFGKGRSFGENFLAAGTYAYHSTVGTVMSGIVKVPPSGSVAQLPGPAQIFVRWSTSRMAGFAFDVQYRSMPPGGAFGPWAPWDPPGSSGGWQGAHGLFGPTQAGDTYQFKARLRNVASGNASGFSPPLTVAVPSGP